MNREEEPPKKRNIDDPVYESQKSEYILFYSRSKDEKDKYLSNCT